MEKRMTQSNTPITGEAIHEITASAPMHIETAAMALPQNPRIRKAELVVTQQACAVSENTAAKLGLYCVTDGTVQEQLLDYCPVRTAAEEYRFNVTALLDDALAGETDSVELALRLLDGADGDRVCLYGSAAEEHLPSLRIDYDSCYGVGTAARTYTHDLGRLGQGSIDLQTRSLMLQSEDFVWGGNRMPVTIRHLYNSALAEYRYTENAAIGLHAADFSAMHIGLGWKLNLMQSMTAATFMHDGETYVGFVYNDENGEDTYFKRKEKTLTQYEDVDGGEMRYDSVKRTLTVGGEVLTFDTEGHLITIADEYDSHMDITYTDGLLTAVTDGADRVFNFDYNDGGFLTKITAPDNTTITYSYAGERLNVITYADDTQAKIFYSGKKPTSIYLYEPSNLAALRTEYTYDGDRVASVAEYGLRPEDANGYDIVTPLTTAFAYSAAANRATVTVTQPADTAEGETAPTVTTTVYTFDDDSNVVGEYMYVNGENVGLNGTGDPQGSEKGIGARRYSDNMLTEHDFWHLGNWVASAATEGFTYEYNYSGTQTSRNCLLMHNSSETNENGIYQDVGCLPAGDYTFSVYTRYHGTIPIGADLGVRLSIADVADESNPIAVSERVRSSVAEFERIIVPFHLETERNIRVKITMKGTGHVFVDNAQLESNPYAGPYNKLINGSFDHKQNGLPDGFGWGWSNSTAFSTEDSFNGGGALRVTGMLDEPLGAYQQVDTVASASVRETFTLSGWAKGNGLPTPMADDGRHAPTFRLRAQIKLQGIDQPEEYTADFTPATTDWQYASVQFCKAQYAAVEYVRVYCDYDYNTGVAYFDDIQLVRDLYERGLTAEDFPGIEEETDEDVVEETAEEDTTTEDTVPDFEELRDSHGNPITETTFTDGEFGTVYRSFEYDENGNNLIRETDARGNTTDYIVDPATSRNTAVIDRCGNKTTYEYDAQGRTTKVTNFAALRDENGNAVKDAEGNYRYEEKSLAQVSYGYNAMSNLTSITRGDGMAYNLTYSRHHSLASIGIDGKAEDLITYAYKNGDGRLKQITYANGHTMKATYNGLGELIAERWYESEAQAADSTATPIAHYKYVYDEAGNIVRSIDISAGKEYDYHYEGGLLKYAAEYNVVFGEYDNVTSRTLVNSITYSYDKDGNLIKKAPSIARQTFYYEHPEEGSPIVKFTASGRTITGQSKTDSFGRKVFDELQLGKGFVSRQFMYHAGEVTDEHAANEKTKSSPVCHLVSQIVLSDGRTISYEYDAEERITKVIDSVDGEWVYTYDALGQLLTEQHKAVGAEGYTVVNAMTYDNYGNILTKNGVAYTYGDGTWHDLLTGVGDHTISYDLQGNPVSYMGSLMEWEKGRQLKKLTKPDGTVLTYTYNANGIRTSKTVGGVKHEYVLDGTKILYEGWDGYNESINRHNSFIVPLYDNEDSVCGIIFNAMPYFFLKNLQGDVIAITNRDGEVVARYTYDAWGKVTSITGTITAIAEYNPYRYRGYYHDAETGLYYLQSRYYNPETGRFVNADEAALLGCEGYATGYDLFCYCQNTPVVFVDSEGASTFSNLSKVFESIANAFLDFKKLAQYYVPFAVKKKYGISYLYINTYGVSAAIDTIILIISRAAALLSKGIFWAAKMIARLFRSTFISFFKNIVIPAAKAVWKMFWGIIKKSLKAKSYLLSYYSDKICANSSALISCLTSWGGAIAGALDFISDSKLDSFITVRIS